MQQMTLRKKKSSGGKTNETFYMPFFKSSLNCGKNRKVSVCGKGLNHQSINTVEAGSRVNRKLNFLSIKQRGMRVHNGLTCEDLIEDSLDFC